MSANLRRNFLKGTVAQGFWLLIFLWIVPDILRKNSPVSQTPMKFIHRGIIRPRGNLFREVLSDPAEIYSERYYQTSRKFIQRGIIRPRGNLFREVLSDPGEIYSEGYYQTPGKFIQRGMIPCGYLLRGPDIPQRDNDTTQKFARRCRIPAEICSDRPQTRKNNQFTPNHPASTIILHASHYTVYYLIGPSNNWYIDQAHTGVGTSSGGGQNKHGCNSWRTPGPGGGGVRWENDHRASNQASRVPPPKGPRHQGQTGSQQPG